MAADLRRPESRPDVQPVPGNPRVSLVCLRQRGIRLGRGPGVVLDLGSKFSFTDATQSASGSTRTFASFDAAATDQASSRVWGGVNFSTDTQAGSVLGDQVGQAVLAKFPKAK